MSLTTTVSEISQFVQTHWLSISGAVASAYGLVKGGLEVLRVFDDFREQLTSKDFEVKTTHYKTVIGASSTDVVKLRTIRFHRQVSEIAIDRRPHRDATTALKISQFYSLPGRAELGDTQNFEIHFREDERPRAHSERPVVLGFTIDEPVNIFSQNLDPQWPDPGVRVRNPVGSELLVMEVHFPRDFKLLEANAKPLVWVHCVSEKGAKGKELRIGTRSRFWTRPRKVTLIHGSRDFMRSGVETEFIRVTIEKPPKGLSIHLSWQWKVPAVANVTPPVGPVAIAR